MIEVEKSLACKTVEDCRLWNIFQDSRVNRKRSVPKVTPEYRSRSDSSRL